jgi:GNAT superfamily N-acetyltransferase
LTAPLAIESFNSRRHDVTQFSCGQPSLDRWLHRYAGQGERRSTSRTFVLARPDASVAGYYTLIAGQVDRASATSEVAAGTSKRFPVPVAVLARLAIDERQQGRGLGAELLRDALRRAVAASSLIGIRAVVVDAIDDDAAAFYEHFAFRAIPGRPHTLMVPLPAIIAASSA